MENTYHYYAFVSYATTDSKWAKWLQHQLSYYHIPSAVRKSKIGVPQKIRPIFIYEYDLAGNQLHQAIEQELSASKYLIVICSPSAAKSKYVNREVETFIKQGRQEYIIPFIVEGEINASNPDDECFPPALRELMQGDNLELRGANIATNGKRQALVDIVATMLGVRRDLLWNRYKARQMKQRMSLAAMAVIAMLFGLFYWDYTRPTYKYYADYVDVWGVPTGIIELDKEQAKQRYGIYRFEYRRVPIGVENPYSYEDRRVVEVNYINSKGTVMEINQTEHFNRFPILHITYDDKGGGRIESITCCSQDNKKIVRYEISDDDNTPAVNYDIKNISTGGGIAHAKSSTTIKAEADDVNAKISRYHYFRDENTGLIKGVSYHRNNDRLEDSLIGDADGVCTEYYTLDSLGRIISRYYFNQTGERHIAANGVSVREYEYDQYGNISKTICKGLNDSLINNDSGWAIGISVSDEYGNALEEYYLNANNNKCISTDGCHKICLEYDTNHIPCKIKHYDIYGNLCVTKLGYAYANIESDQYGRFTEISYFNHNKLPCNDVTVGCHITRLKYYGKENQVAELSYYNVDGYLCPNKDGYAIQKIEYNTDGNIYIERRFDENQEPTFGNDGVSAIKYLYERDKLSYLINYGVDNYIRNDATGCAIYHIIYDDRGNVELIEYRNNKDNVANNSSGYAYIRKEYNDSGQQILEEYYNEDQELCINPEMNCARVEYEYDENGNVEQISFWGEDNTRCLGLYGAAIIDCMYDNSRNIIQRKYYNEDYTLMEVDGAAIEENIYNNVNQCIESKYYDTKNRLLRIERNEYDELGNCVKTKYYNANKQPYMKDSEVHTVQYIYEGLRLLELIYLGDNNEMKEGPDGYARLAVKYDERGNEKEKLFYDKSNSLRNMYARIEYDYNSRGQLTKETYYNAQNQLVECPEGYAQGVINYDKYGNVIDRYFIGADGELLSFLEEGVARIEYMYDDRGNCIETRYYNEDNKLRDDGFAKILIVYNERNDIIKITFNNNEGPCMGPENYATKIFVYDEQGNLIEESYYGVDDTLCLHNDGYAKMVTGYNEQGDAIEQSYYGIDNELCVGPFGYAKATVSDSGEVITFYDENGNDITEKIKNNLLTKN